MKSLDKRTSAKTKQLYEILALIQFFNFYSWKSAKAALLCQLQLVIDTEYKWNFLLVLRNRKTAIKYAYLYLSSTAVSAISRPISADRTVLAGVSGQRWQMFIIGRLTYKYKN